MGFISNQWLGTGRGARNRSYKPVPVAISLEKATDDWSQRSHIQAEFTARRSNGEHQTLHLTESEADGVAGTFVSCMSRQARDRLLHSLLKDLSDAMLLKALAFDLRRRKRLPKAAR